MHGRHRSRTSPLTAVAPIAQHRERDPQLDGDLQQRPAAARQQGNRLSLELIHELTPPLLHSTPFRSARSLAKVSTNSGEAHSAKSNDESITYILIPRYGHHQSHQ